MGAVAQWLHMGVGWRGERVVQKKKAAGKAGRTHKATCAVHAGEKVVVASRIEIQGWQGMEHKKAKGGSRKSKIGSR